MKLSHRHQLSAANHLPSLPRCQKDLLHRSHLAATLLFLKPNGRRASSLASNPPFSSPGLYARVFAIVIRVFDKIPMEDRFESQRVYKIAGDTYHSSGHGSGRSIDGEQSGKHSRRVQPA